MNLRNFLMAGLMASALTACSSKPASDLYVLRVPESAGETTCTGSRSLIIDRPSAPNEYDTKRIAVMLDHNHLSYYTGAAWASPFPEQLAAFLGDAFAMRGVNVVDASATDADRMSTLHLTIHEADVTNLTSPTVHLRLTGTISNPNGRRTRFRVNEAIPAEENHMPHIVEAYDQAALNAVNTISKAMKLRCTGI